MPGEQFSNVFHIKTTPPNGLFICTELQVNSSRNLINPGFTVLHPQYADLENGSLVLFNLGEILSKIREKKKANPCESWGRKATGLKLLP
jgi:hypothetical protein